MGFAGVGLWFNQQWARFLTIGMCVFAIGWGVYALLTKGVSLLHVCFPIFAAWSGWQIWKDFSPARIAEEAGEQKSLVSLVLLLKAPRYLEESVLQQIVSSAWGEDYSGKDEDAGRFVVGNSPMFLVHSGDVMYLVNNFDRPYFDKMEEVVKAVEDKRLATAIEQHKGWLSVDLLGLDHDQSEIEKAYPKIARLVAELSGPDCLVVYQPETQRINVWDEEMEQKLRSDRAIEEFAVPNNVPVWEVSDDDPRMKAAEEEAKRTWPEFVEAFRKKDGETFSVKVPITVGEHTEFIWVNVTGLEPDYIHGTLGNDPVSLEGMKLGDVVEVPVKDLNDWGIMRRGELVGCFTTKVLGEIHKERTQSVKRAK
jgi:uncharacterized protein YegJ (DUF2314 family)